MATTVMSQPSIDPTSHTSKHTLQFSDAPTRRREPDRRYYSLRYNHKLRGSSNKGRKSTLNVPTSSASGSRPSVNIVEDGHGVDKANTTTFSYEGAKLDYPASTIPFALVHDSTSNTFTLQRLAASYAFNLTGDSVRADAIHDGDTFDKTEKRSSETTVNGNIHTTLGSAATSPAHSINLEVSGAESEQDDVEGSNPYDWRHYLKGLPTSSASSDDKPKQNGGSPAQPVAAAPISRISSPLAHSRHPSKTNVSPSSPAIRAVPSSSNAPKQPPPPPKRREPTNPLRAPASNKRPRNASAVSAPSSQSRPLTPAINVETPTPTTTSTPHFKTQHRPHSYSAPQRPQTDPNELIIEGEDEHPSARRATGTATPSYMTPSGGRPMSLREAASRGASPLMPPRSHPANGHSRSGSGFSGPGTKGFNGGDDDIIDFGDGGDDGTQSRRSNGDVETDLELGSPAYAASLDLPMQKGAKDGKSPDAIATSPAYACSSDNERVEDDEDAQGDGRGTRSGSIDELESALQDALGGSGDGVEEVVEDEAQDIGDALAEALAEAGGAEGDEESEEE